MWMGTGGKERLQRAILEEIAGVTMRRVKTREGGRGAVFVTGGVT